MSEVFRFVTKMSDFVIRNVSKVNSMEMIMKHMFNSMMKLVEKNETFYFTDYTKLGNTYRVFSYRLASYTDFLEEYALEMRGTTFLIRPDADPLIVSRPFDKFFNLDENPFTANLDLTKATHYEEKADGSLIATYYDPITEVFGLKSKQAFFSEQAIMAEAYLKGEDNIPLGKEIMSWVISGHTVLMELCSPANRIVLEYPTTHLKVHGIRNNLTGEYVPKNSLDTNSALFKAWVNQVEVKGLPENFVASTVALNGIEGYVVHGPWGRFKLKTQWYCNLHHLKDSIASSKRLIEAIIYERIDDVKALFKTDSFTIGRIQEMESKIIPVFNHIVKTTEDFYLNNKDLDRKSFAIKGQKDIPECFHLVMVKYVGKEPDYKEYVMKYVKEIFKIEDEKEVANND